MKKVVKFGGSSLADADHFKKAAAIIHADPNRVYVIPSAPGRRFDGDIKVTDMLIEAYEAAAAGREYDGYMTAVEERFNDIIKGLELKNFSLDADFAEIRKALEENPQYDFTASRGEYLNSKIMAAYIGFPFLDPYEVIFFNEERKLNEYKTGRVMGKRLAEMPKAVIPGFYGSAKEGGVMTFSRGGSDVTGSVVAMAAKADVYENWTDVSGFLTTDPKIVKNPEAIRYITYRELRELSYMGASVLHEEAIFPVRHSGIPINIRNTNCPQDEGTWIVESTCQKPDHVLTGIAGKKGFCTILINKAMMNSEVGFGRRVLQAFEDEGISFEHMPSGIDTMTIVVHEDEFLHKEQKVISAIHRMVSPDSIEIESNLALIAVVGRGMRYATGTAARLFTALADKRINIRMIDQGSSELNIILGVENKDFEIAIRAIYDKFIGSDN